MTFIAKYVYNAIGIAYKTIA
uniref:Uncharacterized protein n=1 Tax=Anguilla anguilla TaxID=7936 RepID=A0A0E9V0P7_ANGAN